MLPPRPDEVRDLLKNVTDAASGVDIRDLPAAQDHPWVEDVAPLLFAATTQGFVDFGNLVTSAFPELLTLIAEAQMQSSAAGSADAPSAETGSSNTDPDPQSTISELVQTLRADAEAQLEAVTAAASTLQAHVKEAETVDGAEKDPALVQTVAATDEVISCWSRIAEDLAGLETRVAQSEHLDVAALRAMPAAWQRIVGVALQIQAMQEPLLPAASATLKIVPRSES